MRPVALRTTLPLATLRLTMAAGLRVVIGARGGVRALTVRAMLAAVGARGVDALFDEIPAELRSRALDGIPPALTEMQVGRLMSERAARIAPPVRLPKGRCRISMPAPIASIDPIARCATATSYPMSAGRLPLWRRPDTP